MLSRKILGSLVLMCALVACGQSNESGDAGQSMMDDAADAVQDTEGLLDDVVEDATRMADEIVDDARQMGEEVVEEARQMGEDVVQEAQRSEFLNEAKEAMGEDGDKLEAAIEGLKKGPPDEE